MKARGRGNGWAHREIVPNPVTLLNAGLPARPRAPAVGPRCYPPASRPAPTPQTPPPPTHLSVSLFFRSVAHGAEKIVFITCQRLAALSYATQDSIKLSYTGMKLQNRPGTPQQNYLIPPPHLPKTQRRVFARDSFVLTDREMQDLIRWRNKVQKGHFGNVSFTPVM